MSRGWWYVAILMLAITCGLGLTMPYRYERSSFCPYCRARRTQTSLYCVISLPTRTDETAFARFWRRHVEPQHQHTWWYDYSNEGWGRYRGRHSDAMPNHLPLSLSEAEEIAVLRCLRTPAERRAFVEKLCRADGSSPGLRWTATTAVHEIKQAYAENPSRQDWGNLLRQYGMLP